MEPLLTTEEIAVALGVEPRTAKSWRSRAWRLTHEAHEHFPTEVRRGQYRPREVAAWCRAVGREYPTEWDKA